MLTLTFNFHLCLTIVYMRSIWRKHSYTYLSRGQLKHVSGCGSFSLHLRPIDGLRLLSALWSGCFLFDTFPISIRNFIQTAQNWYKKIINDKNIFLKKKQEKRYIILNTIWGKAYKTKTLLKVSTENFRHLYNLYPLMVIYFFSLSSYIEEVTKIPHMMASDSLDKWLLDLLYISAWQYYLYL